MWNFVTLGDLYVLRWGVGILETGLSTLSSITIIFVFLKTNCKPLCSVANTKRKPNIICYVFVIQIGHYKFTMLQLLQFLVTY